MTFERHALEQAIEDLPLVRRVALSASCAERLLPLYAAYLGSLARGEDLLVKALDRVWNQAHSVSTLSVEAAKDLLARAQALVPDEDDLDEEHIYAQASAIAIVCCLDLCAGGGAASVVSCFEQAYNTVDSFASREVLVEGVYDEAVEAALIAHPLVQQELVRQLRDLNVCSSALESNWDGAVIELRKRASHESIFSLDGQKAG